MFYLWINGPAGEYEITEDPMPSDSHFNLSGEFGTLPEAMAEVQSRIEASKVWAVFYNGPSNTGFVSQEHVFSGNWMGSKHHPFRWFCTYASYYAAEKALACLLADAEQTMAEKCLQVLQEYEDGNEWGDVIAGSEVWPLDAAACIAADPCNEADIAIFADGSRIAWHAGDQKWVVMP